MYIFRRSQLNYTYWYLVLSIFMENRTFLVKMYAFSRQTFQLVSHCMNLHGIKDSLVLNASINCRLIVLSIIRDIQFSHCRVCWFRYHNLLVAQCIIK